MTYLKNFIRDEEGQDMVEYALLLGFVALAAVALLSGIGTSINGLFTTASTKVLSAKTAAS